MSLFGRKPSATPSPAAGPGKGSNASDRPHRRNSNVSHSRQTEHAVEAPRAVDSNFCYGDEQEA